MKRTELEKYIEETYFSSAEYLFEKHPDTCIFRHSSNGKWFAAILEVQKRRLGIEEDGNVLILNTKCDFIIINSLLCEDGFHPAYHMNKAHWISTRLDGTVDMERIADLIDMSYYLTDIKRKNKKGEA